MNWNEKVVFVLHIMGYKMYDVFDICMKELDITRYVVAVS